MNKSTLERETLYYEPTYFSDKYSPTATLLTRRYRLYKLPSGKTRTTIFADATDFANDEQMADYIQSNMLQELSAECDGSPMYVPDEFKADIVQKVNR